MFDAQELLQAKQNMKRVSIDSLKVNDLVLIEAQVQRYKVDAEGRSDRKGDWSRFKTAFQMEAISLLQVGPSSDAPARRHNDKPIAI